jgi:hypothetical protein
LEEHIGQFATGWRIFFFGMSRRSSGRQASYIPHPRRVHIPVDGERGFQRIVNADSKRT